MATKTSTIERAHGIDSNASGCSLLRRTKENARKIVGSVLLATAISVTPAISAQKQQSSGFVNYTYGINTPKYSKAKKFKEQKYDIQQVLFLQDRNYKSKEIWTYITPPETGASVAYLLNVRDEKSRYWFQEGICKGISNTIFKKGGKNYSICYQVQDGSKTISHHEVMIGELRPKERYMAIFKIKEVGEDEGLYGIIENQNNVVLSKRVLLRLKNYNGNDYLIAPRSVEGTGVMAETISKDKRNSEQDAIFELHPNTNSKKKRSTVQEYVLGEDIGNTVLVGSKEKKSKKSKALTEYYPRKEQYADSIFNADNILNMDNVYVEWAKFNREHDFYTFTTMANADLEK